MHKIFRLICALGAALLFFVSCNFDKEQNMSFAFEVQANIQDEDAWKVLEQYFKDNYINESCVHTFYTTYSDAFKQSVDLFEKGRNEIDYNLILDTIQDEDDVVYLLGILSGEKSREIIASTYWDYNLKQELRPDPAE